MKTKIPILALTALIIHFPFYILNSSAAVPLKWTVETSRVQPAVFEAIRGESLYLEAALQSNGKPLAVTNGADVRLLWQTNGMDRVFWSTNAVLVSSNVIAATFLPSFDPGAATVTGFLGIPGSNYRAAFQLRFRHGPGAIPNELPLPTPTIDFARVTVLNPQEGMATNALLWNASLRKVVTKNGSKQIGARDLGAYAIGERVDSAGELKSGNTVGGRWSVSYNDASNRLHATWRDAFFVDHDEDISYLSDIPAVVAPSTDASADGKAADAKKTGEALEGKLSTLNPYAYGIFYIGNEDGGAYLGAAPFLESDPYAFFVYGSGWQLDFPKKSGVVALRAPLTSIAGNLASLTADGDLADSGIAKEDVYGKLDVIRLAPAYSNTTAYSVGDTCSYNGAIYQCVAATSGEWDSTKWAERNLRRLLDAEIDADSPRFSNEVLAVGLNISTNDVAAIHAMVDTFSDLPIGTGATTIGGLLAALAAAVALLRKKTQLLDNEGKATNPFATDLLGKPVANAKVRYTLSTTSSATMADRTVNILTMTQSETLTFPTATTHDNKTYARDFLLKLTYTAGTMELPQGVTKAGDELSFEAGKTYLIAFTEIAADKFYVRAIDITEAQA